MMNEVKKSSPRERDDRLHQRLVDHIVHISVRINVDNHAHKKVCLIFRRNLVDQFPHYMPYNEDVQDDTIDQEL